MAPTSAAFSAGPAAEQHVRPGPPGLQPPPGAAYAADATSTPSGGRKGLAGLVTALLIIGPVVGISVGVWAVLRARDAGDYAEQIVEDADDTADSILADVQDALDDVEPVSPVDLSLPVPPADVTVPAVSLFDPAGATALIGTYEAAIGATPSKLMRLTIYPDYAFATAQDPTNAVHVDEYPYRDGVVGPSSPVTLVGDGDLEANLFATTDVDWTFLSRAVAEAPSLMPTVEEGVVTHIIVERSVFTPDFSVVVRVYVSGPRGGGYVEYTATGELVQVMV